jgi:hypothetical protein
LTAGPAAIGSTVPQTGGAGYLTPETPDARRRRAQ